MINQNTSLHLCHMHMHSASVLPPPASFYRRDIPLVFLCESVTSNRKIWLMLCWLCHS